MTVGEAATRAVPHILVMALVVEADLGSDAHAEIGDALAHLVGVRVGVRARGRGRGRG